MASIFLGSMAPFSCMAFHLSRISCFGTIAFNVPSRRLDLQLYQPSTVDLRRSLPLGKLGVILKSFADRSLVVMVSSLTVGLHL